MSAISPLLTPFNIGSLTISNRIVMAPMTRDFSPGGVPTEGVAAYYRRRAEGGVGLILTEGIGVQHDAAVDSPSVPILHGDAAVLGWRKVVAEVHRAGGHIIPQLWHQGAMRDAQESHKPDVPAIGPSAYWGPSGGMVSLPSDKVTRLQSGTVAMSEEDIADVISAYAQSARNAMAIGFDGIAIHAAHGYLIDNFLWAGTNLRNDRWGGDQGRRTAFAVEVVKAVRGAIGPSRPIFLRFSQFKMQDYRARLAETPQQLARVLQPISDAGVDVFDGSQRYFDTPAFEGSPLNLAGWAKALTGKAAMTVGGVGLDQGRRAHHTDTGAGAADNLRPLVKRFVDGEFDLVGVGRSLLNDPAWLGKAVRGERFSPFESANLSRLT